MVNINGVGKQLLILYRLAETLKEARITPLNHNDTGYLVSSKINLNINITTDYDENYFYFYNNGKLIKRITLEKAYELISKL